MDLDPSLVVVLGVTCLTFVLFLAGLGLIIYTLVARRRAATAAAAGAAGRPTRPSAVIIIIGLLLLLASLAACAYDAWVILATAGR